MTWPLVFDYLSRWAHARRQSASPFYGIHRSVAREPVRWDSPQEPFSPEDYRRVTEEMLRLPRYRAPTLPPGWTMTECGALPPGWTVRDGKPVRP